MAELERKSVILNNQINNVLKYVIMKSSNAAKESEMNDQLRLEI
jgi:hypothetical protein